MYMYLRNNRYFCPIKRDEVGYCTIRTGCLNETGCTSFIEG